MSKEEEYLERLKTIHGDKYTYEESTILEYRKKVTYYCKEHGKKEKKLSHLLSGGGCPDCAKKENQKKCKKDTKYFIEKGKEIFGDLHDYSITEYKHSTQKVDVICKKHGKFSVLPSNYYRGQTGCRKCVGDKVRNSKLKNREYYLDRLKDLLGDNYDFSKSELTDTRTYIKYICKHHGEQTAKLNNLLNGMKCPKCSYEEHEGFYNTTIIERDQEKFLNFQTNLYLLEIKKDKEVFLKIGISRKIKDRVTNIQKSGYKVKKLKSYKGNLYDVFNFEQLIIKEFSDKKYRPEIFFKGHTECLQYSSLEYLNDIFNILNNKNTIEYLNNYIKFKASDLSFKDFVHNLKLDNLNKLHLYKIIEENIDNHHLLDRKNTNTNSIHIFEDEWRYKKNIVKSRIKNILGKSKRIQARKTIVKEISNKESKTFLQENHLQGEITSKINLGLYYEDRLVSVMTFGGLRKVLGNKSKKDSYELLRFCNKLNTNVVGGASKLLKYFERNYKPKEIISYADYRWSNGDLYEKLGFKFIHLSKPNYFYVNPKSCKRLNRFKFRKSELIKEGYSKDKTERQIMEERGYLRIYDCGALKYQKIFDN